MKQSAEFQFCKSLDSRRLCGKTVLITGGSRGIGRAIALRVARDGANVAILAKTVTPNPKLPGTIHTVAKEVIDAGGFSLAVPCDIRDENQIEAAVKMVVEKFGGIDIVINNASAISLTDSQNTTPKAYDLMHSINVRGTFLVSKACIPFLLKSSNPHIIAMSPPIDLDPSWFASHTAYTMSKFGMSMVIMGLAAELQGQIAVNGLWPRTVISTSALQAFAGEALKTLHQRSRSAAIVADAAYAIMCQPSDGPMSGIFAIDEVVLRAQGIHDLTQYAVISRDLDLAVDLFVDEKKTYNVPPMVKVLQSFYSLQSKI